MPKFNNTPAHPEAPAISAAAITKSDSVAITNGPTRAVYVGVGGDVVALLQNDTDPVTFKNVPTGVVLPICALRINATGSTATDLVALF